METLKNSAIYAGLNLITTEKPVGIIVYTISEAIYNEYFSEKNIMPQQKVVWHLLTQTLANSLLYDSYKVVAADSVLVIGANIIDQNL